MNEPRWRRWTLRGLQVFSFILVLGLIALVTAPIWKPLDTYGVHDWDAMQAYRFITVKALKDYHQLPFWDPYNCGGHTWWAGYESGSNLVSPFTATLRDSATEPGRNVSRTLAAA